MWSLLCGFIGSLTFLVLLVNVFSSIVHSPPLLLLILIVALYIPFSSLFLLPIDLVSSSLSDEDKLNFFYVGSKKIILNAWRVNYWLGFLLTWLVLPLVQTYYSSNNFRFKRRLEDLLIYNVKFYLVYLAVAVLGAVYVYISVGLNFASIKSLVVVLLHSYSLILAIWFMGYGLINIPKTLFWDSLVIRLAERYFVGHYFGRLLNLRDAYRDLKTNLHDAIELIRSLDSIRGRQTAYHTQWVEYLSSCVYNLMRSRNFASSEPATLHRALNNYNNRFNENISLVDERLTDEALLSITKNFKDAYYRFLINESVYYNAVRKVISIQDIRASLASHSLVFRAPSKSRFSLSNIFKSSRSKYWYHYYLNPLFLKLMGVFFVLLTALVTLSEVFHNTRLSLINMLLFSNEERNRLLFTAAFILLLLSYMSLSALISLSKTKIFLIYKLIPKNSNPSSCVWYSSYAIRLTIPLCYNFLTLLNKQILSNSSSQTLSKITASFQKSQFALFLGNSINMIALGQTANNILPYFVLVPVLIQLYKIKQSHSSVNERVLREPLDNSFFLRLRGKLSSIINEFEFLLFDDVDDDFEDDLEANRGAYGDLEEDDPLAFNPFQDSSSSGLLVNRNQDNRTTALISKVNRLIKEELENPKSLLNTFDDNYTIFYDSSLQALMDKLRGRQGIHMDSTDNNLFDRDQYDDDAAGNFAVDSPDNLEFEFDGESDEERPRVNNEEGWGRI